LEVEYRKTGVC